MGEKQLESIRNKITAKQPIYGTTITLQEPIICEMAGMLGYDFVWIDGEHAVCELGDIRNHIISAKAGDTASFVRVLWNDAMFLKPVLEMGPDGVIVPFIRSLEEAKYAISAFLYPPKGQRGFGPQRANDYWTKSMEQYLADYEQNIIKFLQVECIQMVDHLDDICKIEGLNALLVGCNDLSASLGILGQFEHPDFIYARDKICDICNKNNIPFGVAGVGIDDEIAWKDRGALFFNLGLDCACLAAGFQEALRHAKKCLTKK